MSSLLPRIKGSMRIELLQRDAIELNRNQNYLTTIFLAT